MFRHRVSHFEQEVVTIHPGEYFATRGDTIIATVLGSCVAVGLFDLGSGVGGLNHFMLPARIGKGDFVTSESGKYGMYAMELLLNELLKLDAHKRDIRAKVFGGGSVLGFSDGSGTRIPQGNIDFAFAYLEKEGIPVLASDVGGLDPRKIFFFARSGKVLLKRIGGTLASLAEREEERYREVIQASRQEGPIVMFDDDRKP